MPISQLDTGSGTISVRDILDLMALGDQDWIDEASSKDEKKIMKTIVQPNKFCQTCFKILAGSLLKPMKNFATEVNKTVFDFI